MGAGERPETRRKGDLAGCVEMLVAEEHDPIGEQRSADLRHLIVGHPVEIDTGELGSDRRGHGVHTHTGSLSDDIHAHGTPPRPAHSA